MGEEEFPVMEMGKYFKNIMIINYASIKKFIWLMVPLPMGLFLWLRGKKRWNGKFPIYWENREATRAQNVDSFVLMKKVFLWEGRYAYEPFWNHWIDLRAELGF